MIVSSGLKYTLQISTTQKIWKKYFEKSNNQELKISYCRCSKWNPKISFQHLKQDSISNNPSNNTNSANLSSTNLVNVMNANHEFNAPNM